MAPSTPPQGAQGKKDPAKPPPATSFTKKQPQHRCVLLRPEMAACHGASPKNHTGGLPAPTQSPGSKGGTWGAPPQPHRGVTGCRGCGEAAPTPNQPSPPSFPFPSLPSPGIFKLRRDGSIHLPGRGELLTAGQAEPLDGKARRQRLGKYSSFGTARAGRLSWGWARGCCCPRISHTAPGIA